MRAEVSTVPSPSRTRDNICADQVRIDFAAHKVAQELRKNALQEV